MTPKITYSSTTPVSRAPAFCSERQNQTRHHSRYAPADICQLFRTDRMMPTLWVQQQRTHERENSDGSSAERQVFDLLRWDFDNHAIVDPNDQIHHLHVMFDHLQIRSLLGVSAEECSELFRSIQGGYDTRGSDLYFKRYYHNFAHAFDVTQTLFAIFGFAEHMQLLTALERVVLLIAAIGHDIAHPGVSNRFLVNTNHPLTLSYGYTSVLENMHAAKTMSLVERHKILRHLTISDKIKAQQLLVTSILGTNVAQHDRLLENVRSIMADHSLPLPTQGGVHNRLKICSFLLHCADISNAAKPFDIAERWTDLIMKEFFEQGEAERRLHLPISPNCDPAITSVPDLQIQFINFAIIPTFSLLESLLPSSRVAVRNARLNVGHWEAKKTVSALNTASLTPRPQYSQNSSIGVFKLVSRHSNAYWRTVMMAILHCLGWFCAVLSPTLVDFAHFGGDFSNDHCRKSDSTSSSIGELPIIMPVCALIAGALGFIFEMKSSK